MGSTTIADLDLEQGFFNIINGEKRTSLRSGHGTNPSNLEKLPDVPVASSRDVDDAVAGARSAFMQWSEVAIDRRRELLNQFINSLETSTDRFARLLTLEQGKPVCIWRNAQAPNAF